MRKKDDAAGNRNNYSKIEFNERIVPVIVYASISIGIHRSVINLLWFKWDNTRSRVCKLMWSDINCVVYVWSKQIILFFLVEQKQRGILKFFFMSLILHIENNKRKNKTSTHKVRFFSLLMLFFYCSCGASKVLPHTIKTMISHAKPFCIENWT